MDNIIITYIPDPSHCSVLKIGANNGQCPNDNIFGKMLPTFKIIFVEPVPRLFNELKKYYDSLYSNHNFIFLNKAVSSKIDKLKIYYPSVTNDFSTLPWWIDQLSGSDPLHFSKHGFDIDLDFSYIPTTTINQICKDYNIKTIDYLSVDTEGHDFDILMAMDLEIVKPKFITFEHLHMDGYKTQGVKYSKIIEHFKTNGYIEQTKDYFTL